MKISKLLLLAALGLSLAGCVSGQTDKRRTNKNTKPKNTKPMNEKPKAEPTAENVKIVAEGVYESLDVPFIFVARSLELTRNCKKLSRKSCRPHRKLILRNRQSSPLLPEQKTRAAIRCLL
jgi:hypothetical protein